MAFQSEKSDLSLDRKVKRPVLRGFALFKRQVQGSGILFIVLSAFVGWCAGVMAALLGHFSHLMQAFLYGFRRTCG